MGLSAALFCLAVNVYHESRGEPLEGQMAVALVTLNRARESKRNVCDVVVEKDQFSWTKQGVSYFRGKWRLRTSHYPKKRRAWNVSVMVAKAALGMADFTLGSTHFHADYVSPKWAKNLVFSGRWGRHLFYRRG